MLLKVTIIDSMASLAGAIFVLLHGTRFTSVVLAFRLKIIGMTRGAETGVFRKIIANGLAVAVACNTCDGQIVVARVVDRCVGEIDRSPCIGRMASVALLSGNKMRRGFSDGRITIVT